MSLAPRLRTPRLTLRPIGEDDFEDFYRLLVLDPEVIAYYFAYRAPLSDAERRARARKDFFDHFDVGAERHGYICWALCLGELPPDESGALAGWCGVVTEAARAVVVDGFARYGLEALHAVVDTTSP